MIKLYIKFYYNSTPHVISTGGIQEVRNLASIWQIFDLYSEKHLKTSSDRGKLLLCFRKSGLPVAESNGDVRTFPGTSEIRPLSESDTRTTQYAVITTSGAYCEPAAGVPANVYLHLQAFVDNSCNLPIAAFASRTQIRKVRPPSYCNLYFRCQQTDLMYRHKRLTVRLYVVSVCQKTTAVSMNPAKSTRPALNGQVLRQGTLFR